MRRQDSRGKMCRINKGKKHRRTTEREKQSKKNSKKEGALRKARRMKRNKK